MSWNTLDAAVREIAERELTDGQLTAWRLEVDGYGIRAIAFELDLAKSTVSDRITAAHRNLRRAGVRQTAGGSYYLEETA